MQRVFLHVPHSMPPMYAWPRPVKYTMLGVCAALCLAAYGALAAAILSLLAAVVAAGF